MDNTIFTNKYKIILGLLLFYFSNVISAESSCIGEIITGDTLLYLKSTSGVTKHCHLKPGSFVAYCCPNGVLVWAKFDAVVSRIVENNIIKRPFWRIILDREKKLLCHRDKLILVPHSYQPLG